MLVVELLGRSNGMGFQLQVLFQLFDVTGILAYTIAFIVVVQIIEFAVLQPLEIRAGRWRRLDRIFVALHSNLPLQQY